MPCDGGDTYIACFSTSRDAQAWENPPSRGEIRIIEELFAVGQGAPLIRQHVLGVRLGLDVAEQLEDMGIYESSALTPSDTRKLSHLAHQQLNMHMQPEENALAVEALADNDSKVQESPSFGLS